VRTTSDERCIKGLKDKQSVRKEAKKILRWEERRRRRRRREEEGGLFRADAAN
jgi:hypothetical protein